MAKRPPLTGNRWQRAGQGFKNLGKTIRSRVAHRAARVGVNQKKIWLTALGQTRGNRFRAAQHYVAQNAYNATTAAKTRLPVAARAVAARARSAAGAVGGAANRAAGRGAYAAQNAFGAAARRYRGLPTGGKAAAALGAAAAVGGAGYAGYRYRQRRLAAPKGKSGGGGAAAG